MGEKSAEKNSARYRDTRVVIGRGYRNGRIQVRWKDSWLQTNLPRRLPTDAEVNPACSRRDQTFGSGQHYGRNKERMVDFKTKIESEENGPHVQRLQNFQHETL